MTDPLTEAVARIIDPSSWAVMDSYLADMLRKYKGEDKAGWMAGAYDCIRIIQAFTAHRIAAERRGIERAAQVADEHACQHCAHIPAAIRSLTEGA